MRGFLAAMDAAGVAAVTPVALIMSSRVGVSIDGRGSALLDSREAVAPSPPRAGRHVSRTRRRAGARAGTLTPARPANRRTVPGDPEPPHPLNQVAKPHAASPPRAQGFAGDRLTQPRTRDRLTAWSSEFRADGSHDNPRGRSHMRNSRSLISAARARLAAPVGRAADPPSPGRRAALIATGPRVVPAWRRAVVLAGL